MYLDVKKTIFMMNTSETQLVGNAPSRDAGPYWVIPRLQRPTEMYVHLQSFPERSSLLFGAQAVLQSPSEFCGKLLFFQQ